MGTLLTGIALWMSNLNTIVLPPSGFAKIAILPVSPPKLGPYRFMNRRAQG